MHQQYRATSSRMQTEQSRFFPQRTIKSHYKQALTETSNPSSQEKQSQMEQQFSCLQYFRSSLQRGASTKAHHHKIAAADTYFTTRESHPPPENYPYIRQKQVFVMEQEISSEQSERQVITPIVKQVKPKRSRGKKQKKTTKRQLRQLQVTPKKTGKSQDKNFSQASYRYSNNKIGSLITNLFHCLNEEQLSYCSPQASIPKLDTFKVGRIKYEKKKQMLKRKSIQID